MQIKRILFSLLIICISFLISTNIVSADTEDIIVCEYNEFGLKISFDKTTRKVKYEFDENLNSENAYIRSIVSAWNANPNVTIEEEFSTALYDSLMNNSACPTGFHMGLLTIVENEDTLSAFMNSVTQGHFGRDAKIEKKIIYFAPESEFKENYKPYTFGAVENIFVVTSFEEGYKSATQVVDNKAFAIVGGVYNTFVEDGLKKISTGVTSIINYRATGEIPADPLYSRKAAIDLGVIRYTGPYRSLNFSCYQFSVKLYNYSEYLSSYDKCIDEQCKTSYRNAIKDAKEALKNQCRSMLQNYDYSGGEADCLNDCINISNIFIDYEKGSSFYRSYEKNCGFSTRLGIWISNILRWIKYIVPIILIVLSILDFIKALASEKDDEMNKAKKNFVVRLIAAVLIFIFPLIIEFALEKMGFTAENCGIEGLGLGK